MTIYQTVRFIRVLVLPGLLPGLLACQLTTKNKTMDPANNSAASAQQFIAEAAQQMQEAETFYNHAGWLAATYINEDSQYVEARAFKELTLKSVNFAARVKSWDNTEVAADTRRQLDLLRSYIVFPTPNDEVLAQELSTISSKMQAIYGAGQYCRKSGECFDLLQMSDTFASSRDPELLRELWQGWREVSPPMRPMYARQVEIANAGARDLGFANLSEMWRSNYDMSADEFTRDLDHQWQKVKPLYEALHCHVRAKLNDTYGDAVVPKTGKIPAHLLGNMWGQTWSYIYDLVKPENSERPYDLTKILVQNNISELQMVHYGEDFFSSLGFAPLPETFWQRSMFIKPRDREVVCHASAWNVDGVDDLRIKMCTQKNAEDFYTIHHELGHNYYQRAYNQQPYFFRTSANAGFHEALGDAIALSITPNYLQQLGLLDSLPPESSDLGFLMEQALDKVAFLPFGLLVDKWRWQVFNGQISEGDYNKGWWQLREAYQGISAPVARSEHDFDPGAKYHIPGNSTYIQYFLAYIQQFQFHRALCDAAGYAGPLHRCSIYGSKEAGEKLQAMMAMGASRPWPDAMEALTGQRELDASAIVDYFAPVKAWLDKQNKDRRCGW